MEQLAAIVRVAGHAMVQPQDGQTDRRGMQEYLRKRGWHERVDGGQANIV